ncbi:UDP-glucose 4-epimerase GalE [Acetanaerobacterium elongatum]|uniref:UDP-glucose 4-epimerase n=1 Tax=Acetanaerobacterium elongatum TaxID=258515 RepID=A0A1H0FHM3_9FIRM|nr:UDP-glucose 4-epimerase GalE [Acetanaerobacterium elongatum]SDN93929.1 UDP-galactose 4-epimerase [Acetanaerobacterium elongatum]
MKILVTGGAGFIGSHTCVELLNAGYEVVVADNLSNAKEDIIDRIRKITGKTDEISFYKADIRDKAAMHRIFTANDIKAVIHFAGLKAVGESVAKPLEYYDNNIAGTIALCEEMRDAGCKTIVFSSSATVYGMNNPVPFVEDYPTSATNPYGYTKVAIERILIDLAVADKDWSAVLLRYFNPIGAHESGLIGENPNGIPNNLLPYVSQVAVGKLPFLNVFGNDYDTPDGTGVRDYIHVVDLARGHLNAVEYGLKHKGSEAINLGTGKGSSVLEIVEAFKKASGRDIPVKFAPRRPGDIATCYADTAKAKKLLGWEAVKDINDMCADGWRFIDILTKSEK